MSLKAFHLVFIAVCTLFAVSFGVWAWQDYRATGTSASLALSVGSLAAAPALFAYARWVLRKLERIGYL